MANSGIEHITLDYEIKRRTRKYALLYKEEPLHETCQLEFFATLKQLRERLKRLAENPKTDIVYAGGERSAAKYCTCRKSAGDNPKTKSYDKHSNKQSTD